MNKFSHKFIVLSAFVFYFASCSSPKPPLPYGAIPSQKQIDWQKMEYYMFIHFGPNTFTDVEWGNGKEDPKVFNPSDLDCRQWAATAKAAGMKGIILTVKHHDGFCLWPSKYSNYTVRESLWKDGKGDVLKELSEACKEYGLKLGVYLSPWDRNHPDYGTPEYNQVFANTLAEIHDNYGDIFEQWFDGANGDESHGGKKQMYDWPLFYKTVYDRHPNAMIFSDIGPDCRWMGNERGIAGETNWSKLNIEGFGPGIDAPPSDTLNMGNVEGLNWIPAEVDVSIRPGWFYSPSTDDKVKSVEQLMDIYYTSVGRNANLLLNVPADRSGKIHPNDSTRLMEFRRALDNEFVTNLAKGAKIKASDSRNGFGASNLLDDDYNTYWATNDDVTSASLEIDLKNIEVFNRIVLQEYIPLGQRVAEFDVEYWDSEKNDWQPLVSATTIGYKRILRFPTISSSKVRINIRKSLACPVLNNVEIYKSPEQLSVPTISRSKDGMVTINCKSNDPAIFYTLDGSNPTVSSNRYTQPFSLVDGGIVKAIAAVDNGNKMSEIVTVDFDLAPVKWKIEFSGTNEVEKSIDGNPSSAININKNESLVIDMGESVDLKGFSYTPVRSTTAPNIVKYNFYVSADGKKWEQVEKNGVFNNIKNNPIKQDIRFAVNHSARYLKLEVVGTVDNSNVYSVAELGVITK